MKKGATWEEFLIEGKQSGKCFVCRKETNIVDISFECHICSVDCSKQLWKEYAEACRESAQEYTCQNCNIEMDYVTTGSGEEMIQCGICSYGWPLF